MDLNVTQSNLSSLYEITTTEFGYQFTTETNINYFVTFIDYPSVSDFFPLKLYMFNIERYVPEDISFRGNNGHKVRNTIISILERFFLINEDALITICDIDDGRQKVRKRLFDSWFDCFNRGRLCKLDAECAIEENVTFASLYFNSGNHNIDILEEEFKKLAEIQFYNI